MFLVPHKSIIKKTQSLIGGHFTEGTGKVFALKFLLNARQSPQSMPENDTVWSESNIFFALGQGSCHN